MVIKSLTLFARSRGPDEFWRKRKIFKMSAHFHGRKRNCYSVAIRYVHRALVYATNGRKLKKVDMKNLWDTRIMAACEQFNLSYSLLMKGLSQCNILLNRKSLADLAIWEPRTFKSLTMVAWSRMSRDGLAEVVDLGPPPPGVITRGMLKDEK